MTRKLISFLLPAYNYQEGNILIVKRILEGLSKLNYEKIEIIVSDNSKEKILHKELLDLIPSNISFIYRHNVPATSPSENWNSLIEQSSGEYYIIIHHDEFPYSEKFSDKLIGLIEFNSDIEVIVIDCLLYSSGCVRQHVPMSLKKKILLSTLGFVFLRNIIGPTATMLIKKANAEYFDDRVFWLIDVDCYYRVLRKSQNILFFNELKIISNINRRGSLTSTIKHEIRSINKKELVFLKGKYPEINFYKLKAIDFFFWYPYRFFQRVWQFIFSKKDDFAMPTEISRFSNDDN